jgi:hypothetical protein
VRRRTSGSTFWRRLGRDESAPETLEWVLLLVVALVVLTGIYYLAGASLTGADDAVSGSGEVTYKSAKSAAIDKAKNLQKMGD